MHSSFGRWAPSIVVNCGAIAGIDSDSPNGSLRDQVLASSNLPSDAIANPEVVARLLWGLRLLRPEG
ncbi:hypothetical protein [Actinomadura pelletieri]|uniref:hypothetical protein n=1 Tax=Actinomadura pelletieri TaxID=111805 RepID=UPI000EB4182C|nr:hypothetical protein [Actinomadura pelletieri]